MTTIYVIRGDKLYDINFTLETSTRAPIDLTGATLTFVVQAINSNSIKFTGSMSVLDATSGTCKYTVQPTNFTTPGQYNAEIEISYPSGALITYGDITVVVQPDLPA